MKKYYLITILLIAVFYVRFLLSQDVTVTLVVRGRELPEQTEQKMEQLIGQDLKFRYNQCPNKACEYLEEEFTMKNYYKAVMLNRELERVTAADIVSIETRTTFPNFK